MQDKDVLAHGGGQILSDIAITKAETDPFLARTWRTGFRNLYGIDYRFADVSFMHHQATTERVLKLNLVQCVLNWNGKTNVELF